MKKNKRKRISSKIFLGVLFLSNISLISISFSAWSISGATSAEAQIQVSAADVIDLNQYFTFIESPTIFECTSEGIVNDYTVDTSAKNQEGYIKIPFRIDVKSGKISDHLESGAKGFTLGTTLIDKNSSLDFFSVASVTETKLAYKDSNSITEADFSNLGLSNTPANRELSSTFDLTSFPYLNQTKAFFEVSYKISIKTSNFQSAYSSVNGSFHFSFKVGGIFDHA